MKKPIAVRSRWMMACLLLAVYLGGLALGWQHYPAIANENGLMENLQALTLGLGALYCLLAATRQARRHGQFVLLSLALGLFGFFLREVDVEKLDLPASLIALGSGAGRNLLLLGGVLALLVVFVRNFRELGSQLVAFLKHEACVPLYLGVGCYLAGDLFDKHLIPVPRETGYFLEELCENAATYFLALGVVWTVRRKPAAKEQAVL